MYSSNLSLQLTQKIKILSRTYIYIRRFWKSILNVPGILLECSLDFSIILQSSGLVHKFLECSFVSQNILYCSTVFQNILSFSESLKNVYFSWESRHSQHQTKVPMLSVYNALNLFLAISAALRLGLATMSPFALPTSFGRVTS